MTHRLRNVGGMLTALSMAVGLAACSSDMAKSSVTPSLSTQALIPPSPGPNTRRADVEYIEVCKDYPGGTGPAVTFTVAADIDSNGTVDQTFTITLNAGTCRDVWIAGGAVGDTVRVTETVPAGYTASYVVSTIAGTTITTQPSVSGNSTTLNAHSGFGSLVIFTNTPNTPPPPPPATAGCTPGYWKQDQHFDSWTAPYAPNTLFSAVFENAFPGMTLLQVLESGGGGLDALGRHTVAALLNAASSGVSYGMTPAQVIAAFNAVYPGGNYEGQKNIFATANERGCPLN
jgi:hypothetical protein